LFDSTLPWVVYPTQLVRQLLSPTGPSFGVWLNVELQSVGTASKTEGLVQILFARCQEHCTRRQIERVTMPMKDGDWAFDRLEKEILLALRS
jgi:hypothetical protein